MRLTANQLKKIPKALGLIPLLILLIAPQSNAEQWIPAGDERTRFHVQTLADADLFGSPTNTWPMMWISIQESLDNIKVETLNETQLWSYQYLRHALSRAKYRVSGVKRVSLSNSRPAIVDFATDSREKSEISGNISVLTENFSFKIQGNLIKNPIDGEQKRLDGSYLAFAWGNWVLGAGAIDRWWGSSWQSSAILSNNARPSPGIFIQRKSTETSNLPIIKWVGPWDLHLFANQLEADRYIPNPTLLGARFTFKPLRFFQVGLSKTAMQDGETHPNENNANLIDINTPHVTHQISGYDWRLQIPGINKFSLAIFFQQINEKDNSHKTSLTSAKTWGIESNFRIGDINTHASIETYDASNENSAIYESNYYKSGYRTNGRAIGSSLDTASLGQTVLVEHYFANGHQLNWRIGKIGFNKDNLKIVTPGGHPYGSQHIKTQYFEVTYKLPVTEHLRIDSGLCLLSEPLTFLNTETIDNSLTVGLEYHW